MTRHVLILCFCIFIPFLTLLKAMDADNAVNVAMCYKQKGYEKIADRVNFILKNSAIDFDIFYFKYDKHEITFTNEKSMAKGFLIIVNIKYVSNAKNILRKLIKENHLPIIFLKKHNVFDNANW